VAISGATDELGLSSGDRLVADDPCLQPSVLVGRDVATIAQLCELHELIAGARLRPDDAQDRAAHHLVLLAQLASCVDAHLVSAHDKVDEDPDKRQDEHEDHQSALAQPLRSSLRRMSMNTVNISQIAMRKRKNQRIE
jgi:hypothetical protein